jgi:hypothetical protein
MATQVQLRRGTSAENDSFTGAQGELTYDTTNKRVRIHDGGTAGGFEISRADASNLTFPDGSVGSPAISFASDTNTGIYRGGTDILKFVTAGTDAVTIDASQNVTFAGDLTVDTNTLYVDSTNNRVGIGTTGPATPLDVRTTSPIIRSTYDSTGTYVQMFHNGSNSYFDFSSGSQIWRGAGQAERMRIDSSGNVGIGKSNPSVPLDVNGIIRTTDAYSFSYAGVPGSTSAFGAGTISADANWGMYFKATTGSALADFAWVAGAGTERMRIDSDGNVGIGTSSPNAKLQVLDQLKVSSSDQSSGSLVLGDGSSTNFKVGIARWNGATNSAGAGGVGYFSQGSVNAGGHFFYTGDASAGSTTERMRIDSSGNLLVGQITATTSSNGIYLRPDSDSGFNSTNSNVISLNRLSSDGQIVQFRKDGTTVGSIGTSGSNLAIHGAGSGDDATGLMFVSSASTQRIVPCQQGFTINDGIINLGHTSNRFKDLYLSGGVYLGGTGSANKLDSYEEGTWIPSVDSGTNTVNTATYTKVGRVVTVSAVLSNFSDTTTASIITISGLPFTVAHQGFGICDGERFDVSLIVAQARTSDSKIALKNGVGSADFTSVDYADINDGVDVALSFIVTYFTT